MMSHRLYLLDESDPGADVNLCDHATMREAILAFMDWEQVPFLKVIGPAPRVWECKRQWKRIERERTFPSASSVHWMPRPIGFWGWLKWLFFGR